jgi:hypothetical protein
MFDEPKTEYESHGLDGPPYERWLVCPYCNDNDFVEAKECERCGAVVAELHNGLCDICYDDLEG